ncbi:uncharacterized protein LOC125039913 [Penaeus chinensis]|uniref:uncharacterized protein LOC125039913 n=1 Tax=Penaeus chinensis TaxID=139456 RepID=UPI001FB5E1C1|nr:uncharacterized protein LOC125039913 [Penaeus chinensis]
MALKAALKFLERTHLLQGNSQPLTLPREARATRGLSVGHGNPHCQSTLSLLGSIAGFASLTTLLGIALSKAGSSGGGDASGEDTRTAINISNMWNPINPTVSSQSVAKLPALTEGSSLIESFPFLPDLGLLRSNLSYPDLHRTSPQPVLPGSSINRDATLISLADNTAMKD